MLKKLFKSIVFGVFWLNSRVKEGIWDQNGKMGDALTIQGQIVKIPLQSPEKLGIFHFCPYFSTCFFLTSGRPTSIKIIFSKLIRTGILLQKVLDVDVENCGLRKDLKFGNFLLHFYIKITRKHLVVEWLSWLP